MADSGPFERVGDSWVPAEGITVGAFGDGKPLAASEIEAFISEGTLPNSHGRKPYRGSEVVMNIYQKIVLICGAIALIVVIWITPDIRHEYMKQPIVYGLIDSIHIIDEHESMELIIGITTFAFFVLKKDQI